MQVFLWTDLFLLKVVCLIEVSPKLMQEKTVKPDFWYVILAVCVN